jgi:ABC-type lipoprotein release transport system permease subunit
MKRIVAIVLGVLVLLAAAMMLSVWRASQEPVAHTPGPLEIGQTELRAQLEDAKKIEAQTEQQDWNSTASLHVLIQGHEQRIAKLKDNSQAAEIVAYDRQAITRLEKRITELAEQQAAKAAEPEAQP